MHCGPSEFKCPSLTPKGETGRICRFLSHQFKLNITGGLETGWVNI